MKSLFTKICRQGFVFFCFQLLSMLSFGQNKPQDEQIKFMDNIAAFSDLDYVSGKPNINVKLFQFELNEFSLPITLKYSTTQTKVEDISSWVGFGWNLMAGGSISRVVKDFPDDVKGRKINGLSLFRKYGFIKGGGGRAADFSMNYSQNWRKTFELVKTMGTNFLLDDNQNGVQICLDNDTKSQVSDTEPDEFYINLPGISQKFMLNKDGEVKFLPYSNLKVTYTTDDVNLSNPERPNFQWATKGITDFTVLDEKGNQYYFSNTVLTSVFTTMDRWSIDWPGIAGVPPSGSYRLVYAGTTEWMLTKIITHKGEEISFNYADQPILYGQQSLKTKIDTDYKNVYFSKQYKSEKRLVSIESSKEKLTFDANVSRQDLTNGTALTGINVFNKVASNPISICSYLFHYSYFQSDTNEGTAYQNLTSDDVYKRLKLLDVEEIAAGIQPRKHLFSYNELYTLPNRLSSKKDFWGYFNNSSNNSINKFIPSILVYPNLNAPDKLSVFDFDNDNSGTPFYFFGGYRFAASDASIASAGTLKRITYPTGGYHQYEFEPNTFFYKNKNFTGGGLRLKSETVHDPVSEKELLKVYEYTDPETPEKSSGKIINYPIFAFTENTAGYVSWLTGSYYQVDPYQLVGTNSENYYRYFTSVSSEPEWPLGERKSNDVSYEYIREKAITGGQNNGSTLYKFHVNDFKELLNNNHIYFPQSVPWLTGYLLAVYERTGPCTPTPSPANFQFQEEFDSYADIRGLDFGKFSLPVCRFSDNNLLDGKLLFKEIFNAQGQKVQKEVNEYIDLKEFSSEDVIPAVQVRTFENYKIGMSQYLTPSQHGNDNVYFQDFFVYTPYKFFTSNISLLKKKELFEYTNLSSSLSSSTEYTYTVTGQLKTQVSTNSDGVVYKQTFTYPQEIGITSYTGNEHTDAIYNLTQRNKIDQPIEIVQSVIKGGVEKVTGSMLTLFKTYAVGFYMVINPTSIFKIDKLPNNENFSPLSLQNGLLVYDNHYEKKLDLRYALADRVEEQQKLSDIPISSIYGYANSYVIAEVTNASISDIAYTSFESGANGKWSVQGQGYVTDATNSFSGQRMFAIGGSARLTLSGLNAGKEYICSYWSKNGVYAVNGITNGVQGSIRNGWTYFEHAVTGSTAIDIYSDNGGYIDEVRLYPKGAFMKTYTYDPLVGKTTECDLNNRCTYFEYDGFKRLVGIRDQDRNILQRFCYNYTGLQENCGDVLHPNDPKSGTYTRTNCGAGYTGGSYTYPVPAGKYFSVVSVADANLQAQNDVNANGQNEANIHGSCTASTIYVTSRRENFTGITDAYGDLVLRFYSDVACTIPVSVSNLTVNLQEKIADEYTGTYTQITNFQAVCNGTSTLVKQQTVMRIWNSATETAIDYYYFLLPGTSYTAQTSYQWP